MDPAVQLGSDDQSSMTDMDPSGTFGPAGAVATDAMYDDGLLVNNRTNWTIAIEDANSTTGPELELFYFYQVETLTFLWILFALIVLGNGSVLVALLLSKSKKSRMNFFIMHLAIADLSVGLVSVLTDIVWKTTVDWHAGNVGCKFVKFAQILVTYSSTYVLVALSIDRYDAITHPMNFSGSWHRARWLVASAWMISAVMSIPAIFLNEETVIKGHIQCWIHLSQWQWKLYMTLVAISLFFIPTIIITACYSIIIYTIWTKSKVLSYSKAPNSTSSQGTSLTVPHGAIVKFRDEV